MAPKSKHIRALLLVLVVPSMAFMGCGTGPEPEKMEKKVDQKMEELNKDMAADMDKGRVELTADLRDLRTQIEEYQIRTEARLEEKDLSIEERTRLEEKRAAYASQIARIDLATSDVGMATRETWVDVNKGTRSVIDEVKAWWTLEKEGLDRATATDHDKDGH
jgi:hypothetical protein